MIDELFENSIAPILFFGVIAAGLFLYGYALIHFHHNKALCNRERRYWLNLVYFLPLLGSWLYLDHTRRRRV